MTTESTSEKCISCGFVTTNPTGRCPHCNRPWQTGAQVRKRGIALIVLGILLSGGMTFLMLLLAGIMRPEINRTSARFTGTRSDATFIFGILGTILVLGITGFITGVWQTVTARTNRALTIITVGLGLVVLVLATIFYLKT